MTHASCDQAEGLRRLRVPEPLRIVAVASGRMDTGATTTVVGLAAALADETRNVLVIDENVGASNVAATLGLNAHRDLLDVIRRDKTLDDVIISGSVGLHVLPAGRGMRVLETLGTADRIHLAESFERFTRPMDVVLIDAAPGRSGCSPFLACAAHEVVMVVSPEPTSITAAYALIKRMRGNGEGVFHVLVNKARQESEARVIFDNMAGVARRHLGISLDFTGFVPPDGTLCPGRPPLETHPGARSGAAFRLAAESLLRWPSRQDKGMDLGRFMRRLLQCGPDEQAGQQGHAGDGAMAASAVLSAVREASSHV